MGKSFEDILHRIDHPLQLHSPKGIRRSYLAKCPAHSDQRSSLLMAEGEDGSVYLCCLAGCSTKSVMAAITPVNARRCEWSGGARDV